MHALSFRRELRTIIGSFKGCSNKLRKQEAAQRPPVLAEDELGLLATSVNGFRTRMRRNTISATGASARIDCTTKADAACLLHCRRYRDQCLRRQSQEVGGDLYDIVPIDEHRVAVINGDVSGKGLSADLGHVSRYGAVSGRGSKWRLGRGADDEVKPYDDGDAPRRDVRYPRNCCY